MSRPMHRILFAALLLLLPALSSAGDFLTIERCPEPDELNADGIPIYSSYWQEPKGLPNTCTEAIGEEGAQLYAERKGWTKSLTAPDNGKSRQGFDQVWEDEKTGKLIVIEAEGRLSHSTVGKTLEFKRSHGFYKASTEWCIEICRSVLHSQKATEKSKETAALILQKISERKLEIRLIVTTHFRGVPIQTRTESAVLDVSEEYRGKTPDELISLDLDKSVKPEIYEPDPDLIQYSTAN